MKFYHYSVALLSALTIGLTACGGDDNDGDDFNDANFADMSVEAQKEYVGNVADELSEKLNSPTVRPNIDFLDYVAETYGEEDFDDYHAPLRRMGRSRELIQFADITGIYEYDGEEFVKVGDSKQFIARIPNDKKYGKIEVVVEAGNSTTDWPVDSEDDAYDVRVPHEIKGTVTAGGKTMMTQVVNNSGRNGGNVDVTSVTTLGGMVVNAKGNITPTNGTVQSVITIDGQNVVVANSTLNGHNLTSPSVIIENGDESISAVISNATAKSDILGKIQMNANVKMSKQFEETEDYFEFGYSWSDYASKEAALAACKKACTVYNNAVAGYFTFGNTSTKQATLTFVPDLYEYYSDYSAAYCGEYTVVASMLFADGTTYTDEMFEGVFDNALDRWGFLFR